MEKSSTPNCSICKWKNIYKSSTPYPTGFRRVLVCTAQGYKSLDECYHSSYCKELFEVKTENRDESRNG
jgi:hypothetical protein